MSIGSNIHNIRISKGVTMRELAATTGVTTSLLSQIEHDKANPSINTLIALSNALGTDIREFFQGYTLDEPAEVVHPRDRIRVGNPAKGWVQQYLTGSDPKTFTATYASLSPGASTTKIPEVNNPAQAGYEFGFVLKGRLRVTVEKSIYVLEEGDAITFHAGKKHSVTNAYQGNTEIIWIIIPGMRED